MVAKYDAANPPALKKMLTEGVVQFRQFPASVMDASLKAALEVYAEVSTRNPDFKKIWEHLLAFRNEAYLWWRVAEYSYDDYLIRNKSKT
jgi:TRAP-type mannitol/chloroaromatic compound transport system substrate-binding protein